MGEGLAEREAWGEPEAETLGVPLRLARALMLAQPDTVRGEGEAVRERSAEALAQGVAEALPEVEGVLRAVAHAECEALAQRVGEALLLTQPLSDAVLHAVPLVLGCSEAEASGVGEAEALGEAAVEGLAATEGEAELLPPPWAGPLLGEEAVEPEAGGEPLIEALWQGDRESVKLALAEAPPEPVGWEAVGRTLCVALPLPPTPLAVAQAE